MTPLRSSSGRVLGSGSGTGTGFPLFWAVTVVTDNSQQVSHSVQSRHRKGIREMPLSIENLLIKTTAWLCAVESKQL